MSFYQFRNSIISLKLMQVANHWNEARLTQKMPAWNQIKPSAIKSQLPIVWSYGYDSEHDVFVGRLAGERIARLLEGPFKDLRLTNQSPEKHAFDFFERNKRVATEPAFFRSLGTMFDRGELIGRGERIIMPLASDGTCCDGILGATDYSDVAKFTLRTQGANEEQADWFSLSEMT